MQNSLRNNAILNTIKQLCAILFPLISFAYCSRILGAEELGRFSFSQSIVSYFLLFSKLGIPEYAIREGAGIKENKMKLDVFINELFTINAIATVIAYILLAASLIFFKKVDGYLELICIQSMGIFLTTIGVDWVNSIYEDYRYLTTRYIVLQVIALLCMFLFIKTDSDVLKYTCIVVLAGYCGNILNIGYLRKKGIKPHFVITDSLKRHLIPIFILFLNSLASVVYLNSDITMLGIFWDDRSVGVYTISSKLYSVLKSMVNAIIIVTVPRFSYLISNKKIKEYKEKLESVFHILLLITIPVATGLFLEADKVLYVFAGSDYVSGANVVRILSVAFVFSVFACFFSYSVLMPYKLEKYFLLSTLLAAIINIVLNIIVLPYKGIEGAAITTLIAEIIVLFVSAIKSKKMVELHTTMKEIFSLLLGALWIVAVCIHTNTYFKFSIGLIFIQVTLSAIGYVLVLWSVGNEALKDLFVRVKKDFYRRE